MHQQNMGKKKGTNYVSLNQPLAISSIKFAVIEDCFLPAEVCNPRCDYSVRCKLADAWM